MIRLGGRPGGAKWIDKPGVMGREGLWGLGYPVLEALSAGIDRGRATGRRAGLKSRRRIAS